MIFLISLIIFISIWTYRYLQLNIISGILYIAFSEIDPYNHADSILYIGLLDSKAKNFYDI